MFQKMSSPEKIFPPDNWEYWLKQLPHGPVLLVQEPCRLFEKSPAKNIG
jgi:hypothetical protein